MPFAKMTWLNSLSVKVLLAYVVGAVLSVALIVLTALAIVHTQGDVLSGLDVADATRDMAEELRFDDQGRPVGIGDNRLDRNFSFDLQEDFNLEWIFESLKQEGAYRVMDASGKVVLHSAAGAGFWPATTVAGPPKEGRFEFERDGVAMRGATAAVERNSQVWYVQMAISRRFMHLMYQAFALPFAGAGVSLFILVLLFVFGPCVYLALRVALAPVRRISEAAAGISPRSLHARLPTHAVPSEITPLVDSFNRVLERVEQGYRIQQEFLATAAHELKTPLALVRAQVELSPQSAERSMLLRDVEHMSRQVQQLLHLAEASEVQNYRPVVVDVDEVVHEAAGFLQRMADAAGVRLELPVQGAGVRWAADRGALFTLLKNLLENAIQHSPAGTSVSVEVDTTSLSVRDRGPGVVPDQLPKIFSRFWRGPHRRDDGAGLGLAICQEVAVAHGWELRAERAEPGLRVVVTSSSTAPADAPA